MDITISPISILASSEPAIPVLISVSTWKRSTRICAQIPALTFPIPLLTITTSLPHSVPLQNVIAACSTVSSISMASFKAATSSSIAPMIPIIILISSCILFSLQSLGFCLIAVKYPAFYYLGVLRNTVYHIQHKTSTIRTGISNRNTLENTLENAVLS